MVRSRSMKFIFRVGSKSLFILLWPLVPDDTSSDHYSILILVARKSWTDSQSSSKMIQSLAEAGISSQPPQSLSSLEHSDQATSDLVETLHGKNLLFDKARCDVVSYDPPCLLLLGLFRVDYGGLSIDLKLPFHNTAGYHLKKNLEFDFCC